MTSTNLEFNKFAHLFTGVSIQTVRIQDLRAQFDVYKEIASINDEIFKSEVDKKALAARSAQLQGQINLWQEIGKQIGNTKFAEEEIDKLKKEQLKVDLQRIELTIRLGDTIAKTIEGQQIKRLELLERERDLIKEQSDAFDNLISKREKLNESLLSIQETLVDAIFRGNVPRNIQRNFAVARLQSLQSAIGSTTDIEKRTQLIQQFSSTLAQARKGVLITDDEFKGFLQYVESQTKKISLSNIILTAAIAYGKEFHCTIAIS